MRRAAKSGAAGIGAIGAYMVGAFTPLVWIMAFFEALDYVTGIASAIKNGGLTSEKAVWGFVKKLCYFIMVGVAFLFDLVIIETTERIGLDIPVPEVLGLMSVCYLISTEAVSIFENLSELGVSIPFLEGALRIYRDKISANTQKSPRSD